MSNKNLEEFNNESVKNYEFIDDSVKEAHPIVLKNSTVKLTIDYSNKIYKLGNLYREDNVLEKFSSGINQTTMYLAYFKAIVTAIEFAKKELGF